MIGQQKDKVMEVVILVSFYLLLLLCLFAWVHLFLILYYYYQERRNNEVYKIRNKWVHKDDERWEKYSYDEMYDPSPLNWYGLKWPKEKDFV
jgi:hypothetical protein